MNGKREGTGEYLSAQGNKFTGTFVDNKVFFFFFFSFPLSFLLLTPFFP